VGHLKVLNPFFVKYKWHFLGGLLFVFLSVAFKIYPAVIVRKSSNMVMDLLRHPELPRDNSVFVIHGLQLIALALISGFFLFLTRQTVIVMSRHIEYDQKNQVYKHYQELDAGFFKTHTTGDLMNRISEDVGRVRMYTGPAIMYLANTIVTTFTVLGFMLSVNARLTLIVFLPLPVLSVLIYLVSDMINKQSTKVQEELGNVTTQAQESFSAIRVIKAYAREKFFGEEMAVKSGTYRQSALRMANIEALFGPSMALMIGLSVLLTVWYGGKLTIEGKIEAGNIPEFIIYVFAMTWPFASLGWVTSLIQRASASQQRINEFLDTKPQMANSNHSDYGIKGEIEFRNVSFTYPENNVTALKNISFKLKQGETLGITGPVGSGKSTIITLLTRQYDVKQGEILLDEKRLKDHNLELYRKHCGVVPQEVFLFSDTIKNNIAFGAHEKANDAAVENVAKKAGVYENIISFPDKFETQVGERGVTLSGGQKQRISIARALIGKPRILIFDDCLSAVDTETEELILGNLKEEMKNRTSIVISHRISSLRQANQILYMKDGEIVESGTHEELLALRKNYYALYQLQSSSN
jgi:ATP-binding cassette subfamily B protein